ncbi:Csi2p NDAI_0C02700 [Naumovozyma dairenensis CBS 421]|uniref:Mid2 domain-containing protein n=1 Tax=Naumovozyma dairenensis (strain ATCC 10597 / BCRC 20456 / CBS 421 / NBRC 0211 / NRRL Y-12639) TaxID=1071378 RepID=G0W819_NAUDC|nr:hypothetical protein NDAI_0C02700 [Naumovozyma dairenensis CBS 421]CCD23930.1 hypothetical protein NDAI_0C02700 [Naumovozyma dairenensis CBS 421]
MRFHKNLFRFSAMLLLSDTFVNAESDVSTLTATSKITLRRRELPKLVTTTKTSTSSSSSSTHKATSTNVSSTSNSKSTVTTKTSSVTSQKSMPKIVSSSSSSIDTSQTASVTTAPKISSTPVTIPATDGNYNIYRSNQLDGTVFIAFGSCLAFILVLLLSLWAFLAFNAWNGARKEYQRKAIEEKYQYDPFYFNNSNNSNKSSSLSASSSSNNSNYSDNESDISEKFLKPKNSRMTLYSMNSASALNLLNGKSSNTEFNSSEKTNNDLNSTFRNSMFISPTEILQQETQFNNNSINGSSIFDSTNSTPKIQTFPTQIIANNNGSNFASLNTTDFEGLGLKLNPGSEGTPDSNDKKKNFRPPSVHLDQLLDSED